MINKVEHIQLCLFQQGLEPLLKQASPIHRQKAGTYLMRLNYLQAAIINLPLFP